MLSLSLLSDASSQCLLLLLAPAGHWSSPLPLLNVDDVQDDTGSAWAREIAREIDCKCGLSNAPSVQTCASKPVIKYPGGSSLFF
jgi:hypothetical protein